MISGRLCWLSDSLGILPEQQNQNQTMISENWEEV